MRLLTPEMGFSPSVGPSVRLFFFFENEKTFRYFRFSIASQHKEIFLYIQQLPHSDIFILTAALKADL